MKSLVEEMLTLARADNAVPTAVMGEVSLSDLATDCVLAFEPVAFEAGKPLESDITPDVTVTGDADKLRHLIGGPAGQRHQVWAGGGYHQPDPAAHRPAGPSAGIQPRRSHPAGPTGPPVRAIYRADASRGEQSGFGLGAAHRRLHCDGAQGNSEGRERPGLHPVPLLHAAEKVSH